MSDEDALVRACLSFPDEDTPRLVYADWLDENDHHGRAELIRLAVSRSAILKDASGDARRNVVRDRIRELKKGIDPKWAATFDEFDCLIADSHTVRVRIHAYGPAPKKYGARAIKIGSAEVLFVIRDGWEQLGSGNHYHYFRLPEGQSARDPVITIQVPTDAEVERLASEWHRRAEARRQLLGPWLVEYSPRRPEASTTRSRVLGTHGWEPETTHVSESVRCARFEFGSTFPWSAALLWEQGDDQPPRWIRGDGQIVV